MKSMGPPDSDEQGPTGAGPEKLTTPGSPEAVKQGCTCPVFDNAHGAGYMGITGIYVYSADCPLHDGSDDPERIKFNEPQCDTCGQAQSDYRQLLQLNLVRTFFERSPRRLLELNLCRGCALALLERLHATHCPKGCKGEHTLDQSGEA